MNAPAKAQEVLNADIALLKPGMPFAGGFYVGQINVHGTTRLLIVSPKAQGDLRGTWNDSDDMVEGALSYCDGRGNTAAMAAAGSELAKQITGLEINGFTDWYIPAQDELELMYRTLKPTDDSNYLYGRSGINVSAFPPSYPYTADLPAQTCIEAFREGGNEAFEAAWYWTSTQRAGNSDCAWMQYFDGGGQDDDLKSYESRARAVRSLIL